MRKRSKYRPRFVASNPLAMRFSADVEIKLQMIPHDSLLAFKQARQTEGDWHTLAARCNLGHTVASEHYPDAMPAMQAAQDALRSSWARFQSVGRMGMNGAEYNAIAEALGLIDEMQTGCTRRELSAAMNHVFRSSAV